jgi:hypothetical protein
MLKAKFIACARTPSGRKIKMGIRRNKTIGLEISAAGPPTLSDEDPFSPQYAQLHNQPAF